MLCGLGTEQRMLQKHGFPEEGQDNDFVKKSVDKGCRSSIADCVRGDN